MDYTYEQLKTAYSELPEKIQELVRDEDLGLFIQSIGKENGLTPKQSLEIEYVVVHILLGLREDSDLARIIRDEIKIPGELSWKISRIIRRDIFNEPIDKQEDKEEAKKKHTPYKIPEPDSVKEKNNSPKIYTQQTIQKSHQPPKVPVPKSKLSDSITSIPSVKRHPFEQKLSTLQKTISTPTPKKELDEMTHTKDIDQMPVSAPQSFAKEKPSSESYQTPSINN